MNAIILYHAARRAFQAKFATKLIPSASLLIDDVSVLLYIPYVAAKVEKRTVPCHRFSTSRICVYRRARDKSLRLTEPTKTLRFLDQKGVYTANW